jgi:hypothetical protein
MSASPLDPMMHMLTSLALALAGAALVTLSAVMFLRWLGLHWTWTLPGVLLGPLLWPFDHGAAGLVAGTALLATATGARWHHDDLRHGADRAQYARDRRTPLDAGRQRVQRRALRGGRWIDRRGLAVGKDQRGRTVRIPVGYGSGRHALVVGATGSGKTVTQAFIAGRLIRAGHGAVVIDPKGDRLVRDELEHAARKARRTLRVWTPEGPAVYNPFAHGTDTELADKVLAGETYTEPHYRRQAQRYIGHAVRTLRGARRSVNVMTPSEEQAEWLVHRFTGWWFAAWTVLEVAAVIDTGDPVMFPGMLAFGAFIYFFVRIAGPRRPPLTRRRFASPTASPEHQRL